MSANNIVAASFTGAEDSVDPAELARVSARWPQAEWAVLILDEREGSGRNPSQAWRLLFLDALEGRGRTAAHLCGVSAFERLLSGGPWPELARYGRVQANINARSAHFGKEQVFEVWRRLAADSGGLIIQLHAGVEAWAAEFLAKAEPGARVEALFDESKGRGALPVAWRESLPGIPCGYAGGLSPENVAAQMPAIARAARALGCWIDMETGVRTGERFDLAKCVQVLERARPWIAG